MVMARVLWDRQRIPLAAAMSATADLPFDFLLLVVFFGAAIPTLRGWPAQRRTNSDPLVFLYEHDYTCMDRSD